jgi:hypothetical protein
VKTPQNKPGARPDAVAQAQLRDDADSANGLTRSQFEDLAFITIFAQCRSEDMAASHALKLWDKWQARKKAGK